MVLDFCGVDYGEVDRSISLARAAASLDPDAARAFVNVTSDTSDFAWLSEVRSATERFMRPAGIEPATSRSGGARSIP